MHFAVDGATRPGAVHHQKIVVVDDAVASAVGIDLTIGRWDTREHLSHDQRRSGPGDAYGPRHEVAAASDGDAARVLAQQAHDRWNAATGQALAKLKPVGRRLARAAESFVCATSTWRLPAPCLRCRSAARSARSRRSISPRSPPRATSIYMENQYFCGAEHRSKRSAARLREADGPEVVIVLTAQFSESRLEQESMDSASRTASALAEDGGRHGRLAVYCPRPAAVSVYIHSKIMVIDGRLFASAHRTSTNRSLGFDSECDVAIEADDTQVDRDAVDVKSSVFETGSRRAEHLGVSIDDFRDELPARQDIPPRRRSRSAFRVVSLRKLTDTRVSADPVPSRRRSHGFPTTVPQSIAQALSNVGRSGCDCWPV